MPADRETASCTPPARANARRELRCATRPEWVRHAIANPASLLVDQAHCEKKAAASALSLAARYSDRTGLVDAMIALAKQEIEHFDRVWGLLKRRGIALGQDPGDGYVKALRAEVRASAEPMRLLDILLVSGLIEARSGERFGLMAAAVPDGELRALYTDLATCEAGHYRVFTGLADSYFPAAEVEARLDQLLDREAAIVGALASEPAMHG
jgi:tRNA 2-(methylsulfanyl)-N6-isopentenyladenosine37 hydroxylase